MSDIFISYRREDGWMMANLLYEKLCNMGYSVYLDTRDERTRREDFQPVIEEHLDSSKDHIILISPESYNFRDKVDQYLKEIEITSKRDDIQKIPVIVGNVNQETMSNCEHECMENLTKKTFISFPDAVVFRDSFESFVKRLNSKPNRKDSVLKSRAEIESAQSLDKRWDKAVEIRICAYGIESLLTQESPFFEQMISQGVKFKIVCVNPDSEAAKYVVDNNIREGTEKKRKRVLSNSHNALLDYLEEEKFAKQIEYRVTELRPESMIMIIKRQEGYVNNIKVDYIVTSNDMGETRDNALTSKARRCVYIDDADTENYNYYTEVFDFIWNHSLTKRVEM